MIETDSHEYVTIICLHMHPEKIKTNGPRASQIFIRRNYCPVIKEAVAVRRFDWPRGKRDHAYCYRMTGHSMTNPRATD